MGCGSDSQGCAPLPSILVSSLPLDAEEFELLQFFQECGPIASIRVLRAGGRSTGFALVSFRTLLAAQTAMELHQEQPLRGQEDERVGVYEEPQPLYLAWADESNVALAEKGGEKKGGKGKSEGTGKGKGKGKGKKKK